MRARVYRPSHQRTNACLIWIHGGGLITGTAKLDDRFCAGTAATVGITIVSVDYRLAPKNPFPAPLDDCHAVWRWARENHASLGVDPDRIVVGGQSAGGGLAAALTQRLHDEGHTPIAQWLFCPMLDDRTASRRELDDLHHWVWDNAANRFGWASYLGHEPGPTTVPDYASPARRASLTGLPPTWMYVSDIELFHQEDTDYAQRLKDAGVNVTLDIVTGAPHGFEAWAPSTQPAIDLLRRARQWLTTITPATTTTGT
jgi:acetyl esterase/lipase